MLSSFQEFCFLKKQQITPALVPVAVCFFLSGVPFQKSLAQDREWNGLTNNNWNTANNWTPNNVPNTSTETAVFNIATPSSINVNANTTVGGLQFNAGAIAYTFNMGNNRDLNIVTTGVV